MFSIITKYMYMLKTLSANIILQADSELKHKMYILPIKKQRMFFCVFVYICHLDVTDMTEEWETPMLKKYQANTHWQPPGRNLTDLEYSISLLGKRILSCYCC